MMPIRYTAEQHRWLMQNIPGNYADDVLSRFNETFGLDITMAQLKAYTHNHHLKFGVKRRPYTSIWNDERESFMREIIPGRSEKEIAELFNERFGIALNRSQIKNAKSRLGVKSGTFGGRFVKGQTSHNKGRPQSEWMSPESIERTKATRFDGKSRLRECPLGSLYKDKNGNMYVKVSMEAPKRFGENGKWKSRARIVWEEANGCKVPEGHKVIHVNKIPDDDRIENLALVTMSDFVIIAQMHTPYADIETLGICKDIASMKREIAAKRNERKA